MLLKLIGILLIAIGIAGLFLPILQGMLLITIGALLLFNDRISDIRKFLPEKIPAPLAGLYDKLCAKALIPFYAMLADEIAPAVSGSLLDIGTGPGLLPLEIAGRNPALRITGIDLSDKMIGLANKHRGPKKVEFLVMDAKALAFPDNSFDMVISTGSLHHWKEPARALNEIRRCLKPGGKAWIYDGYAEAPNEDIERCVRKLFWIFPTHGMVRYMLRIHGYTQKEYETAVADIAARSAFKTHSFERRGMMMRMELKKTA